MARTLKILLGAGFTLLLAFLVKKQVFWEPLAAESWEDQYDFIVVGAGAAGAVVANRLSEDGCSSVLLLEGGGEDNHPLISWPFLTATLLPEEINWGYESVVQENACLGLQGHICPVLAGKVMGGGSSLNALIYNRGSRLDYDGWADLGAYGWDYASVLPYFLKSEDNLDPDLQKSGYHSTGGPLKVTRNNYSYEAYEKAAKAAEELGVPINEDYNGPKYYGTSRFQLMSTWQRWSTSRGFLRPAQERPNLTILKHAHVTKVLFDEELNASGVEFLKGGALHRVGVRKEVVLSAGAIGSPKILLQSGVGPKEHLKDFGIKPLVDLPGVGQNLLDHLGMFEVALIDQPYSLRTEDISVVSELFNYYGKGEGLFASNLMKGHIVTHVDENGTVTNDEGTLPNIQILVYNTAGISMEHIEDARQGLDPIVFDEQTLEYVHNPTRHGYTFFLGLIHPKSHGTVSLASTDPTVNPRIDPKYLSAPGDLETLRGGMRFLRRLTETEALKEWGFRYREDEGKHMAQCSHLYTNGSRLSDDFIDCLLRYNTNSMFHMAGTCKMGPAEDRMTVVDPELRVRGVKKLRVADLSIMPTQTSGNTAAPAIMIGEKAADMVRNSHTPLPGTAPENRSNKQGNATPTQPAHSQKSRDSEDARAEVHIDGSLP